MPLRQATGPTRRSLGLQCLWRFSFCRAATGFCTKPRCHDNHARFRGGLIWEGAAHGSGRIAVSAASRSVNRPPPDLSCASVPQRWIETRQDQVFAGRAHNIVMLVEHIDGASSTRSFWETGRRCSPDRRCVWKLRCRRYCRRAAARPHDRVADCEAHPVALRQQH